MLKRCTNFLIILLILIFSFRTICWADEYNTTVTYDKLAEMVTVTGSAGIDSIGKTSAAR